MNYYTHEKMQCGARIHDEYRIELSLIEFDLFLSELYPGRSEHQSGSWSGRKLNLNSPLGMTHFLLFSTFSLQASAVRSTFIDNHRSIFSLPLKTR